MNTSPSSGSLADTLALCRAGHQAAPVVPASVRKERLERLETALFRWADRISEAISTDFDFRSHAETRNFDLMMTIGAIRFARRRLTGWMKPRRVAVPVHLWRARGKVLPRPKVVVSTISPWNFPINLPIIPAAEAITAGNRVMLKPSALARDCQSARTLPNDPDRRISKHDLVSAIRAGP